MDKEKEVEELSIALFPFVIGGEEKPAARTLIKAGYGNVAQAVKEFAEELKKRAGIEDETYGKNVAISYTELDDLIKELYPDDNA